MIARVHEELGQDVDVREVGGLREVPHLLLQHLGRPLGRPQVVVQPRQHLHSLNANPLLSENRPPAMVSPCIQQCCKICLKTYICCTACWQLASICFSTEYSW